MKNIIKPGDKVWVQYQGGVEGYFQTWGVDHEQDEYSAFTIAVVLFENGEFMNVYPECMKYLGEDNEQSKSETADQRKGA